MDFVTIRKSRLTCLPETPMRYLIVRTDVRAVAHDELTSAWANGARVRDERTTPE